MEVEKPEKPVKKKKPDTVTTQTRLPVALYKRLQEIAGKSDRSISFLLRKSLEEHINELERRYRRR